MSNIVFNIRVIGNPPSEADQTNMFARILQILGYEPNLQPIHPHFLPNDHYANTAPYIHMPGYTIIDTSDEYYNVCIVHTHNNENITNSAPPPTDSNSTTTHLVRSPAHLDIQEQSYNAPTPEQIVETLVAKNEEDFELIEEARQIAQRTTKHIIGKPFDESQMSIFNDLALEYLVLVLSGKVADTDVRWNEAQKALLPKGQFIPLSDGSLAYVRNDLTPEEMDTLSICRRIKDGELHFVREFIDIQEQGLSDTSPIKSPIRKKSYVRASFKKALVAKFFEKEIKKVQKNIKNIKIKKNLENKENDKKFVLPDMEFGEIFEQGFEKKYNKMVRDAKLTQRLSDYSLGGGLGKKKRLNRLISQGDEHRYSGAKKKCPLAIEEKIARKSSQVARSVSINSSRDQKKDIEPQMFSFTRPTVNVSPDNETLDTMREMSEAIKHIKLGLDDHTRNSVDKLASAISGIDGSTIVHEFPSLQVPEFMKGSGLAFGLTTLVLLVFSVYKGLSYTKAILAGCAIFAIYFRDEIGDIAMSSYRKVLEWASDKMSRKEEPIEEPPIEEQSLSSTIMDSIIAFIYYATAKSCKWESGFGSKLQIFFNKTKDMRKIKDGMEFTFSYFLSHLQVFVDWLSDHFGFKSYNVCMDNRPEITLYAEKVAECVKKFTEGKILNSESSKEVMNLYTEGTKLAKALPLSIEYAESRKLVQATVGELNHLMMKIRRSNLHNNGPRIQPVGIFLTGPPGVGKTTAITPLMLEVTARTIPADMVPAFTANHNDFIYNRVSENEYFDAYNGQYNTLFDDLGLSTDVAGVNVNPYMEFIRMVNSNSYDLHMAHLDDKGVNGFCSKFVWATSNVNRFTLKSMINSNALTRRFMCSYLVVPAPGYRKDESEGDYWKMALKPGIQFDEGFPHLDFYEYDALEGKVLATAPIKLADVTEHIMAVHYFTQEFGRNSLNLHDKFKTAALLKRPDNMEPKVNIEESKRSYLKKRRDVDEKVEQGGPSGPPNEPPIAMPSLLSNETISDMVSRLKKDKKNLDRYMSIAYNHTLEELGDDLGRSIDESFKAAHSSISSAVNTYKDFIYNVYSKIKNLPATQLVINNIKTILAGLATITAGYGLFKALFPPEDDIDDQGGDYDHHKRPRQTKPNAKKKNPDKFKSSKIRLAGKGHRQLRGLREEQNYDTKVEQLAYDPTCDDIIFKVFKKNVYTICQNYTSDKMGTVTFIGGHDAFMPRHFAENLLSKIDDGILPENATVVLRAASNPMVTYEVKITDLEFFFPDNWEDMDICFVTFPNVFPQAPDIRKFFMEDSEVITQKFSGKLMQVDLKGSLYVPFTEMHPMSDLEYTNYVNPHGYWYPIPTKDGDCGGLLFVSNPLTGVHKIIGFHSAGSPKSGKGYGVRITRSLIDEFDEFKDIESNPRIVEEGAFDEPYTKDNIEPQAFKTLYHAEPSNPPTKTSIIPSPLQDEVREHKFKPAHLRKFEAQGKVVDPWLLARSKYGKSSVYIDQQILNMCSSSYGSQISNKSKDDAPWTKKVFTFEEAVRGVPGVPNCEGVPRNTSAGYPYCLDVPVGHKGKSHFFGSSDDYEFTSDHCRKLKIRVDEIVSKAKQGIRLKHIYFDFLKDERRPIPKADAGSTRLVSACPVDILIATRMYFMDFVRWYMNNRIINGSAVGVNPFSSEWATMKKCLRGNSSTKNMIAGDFKAYDACLVRQIQCTLLDFVNKWYNDGNDLIRAVLFEEVCNSKHIFMDLVYEWPGGNPSGCFLTTILNTYCNNVILRYAGVLAHYDCFVDEDETPKYNINEVSKLLSSMEKQLFILAYGDDNIISVGEKIRMWYNQSTLTKAFAKFGFEYTSENKEEGAEELRTIDEVTFLKRSWKHDPLVHTEVAALDLDVILEMIQWTKKKDKDYNFVCTNVDTCLKELSAHGEEEWNKWSPLIMKAAVRCLDYTTSIANRREALSLQLSRENESC